MPEEKKPPRAQIFRYFRHESRNNNSVLKSLALAVLNSWLLIQMNTFYRNNICDLGWKKKDKSHYNTSIACVNKNGMHVLIKDTISVFRGSILIFFVLTNWNCTDRYDVECHVAHLPDLGVLVVHEVDYVSGCLSPLQHQFPCGLVEGQLVEHIDRLTHYLVIFLLHCKQKKKV